MDQWGATIGEGQAPTSLWAVGRWFFQPNRPSPSIIDRIRPAVFARIDPSTQTGRSRVTQQSAGTRRATARKTAHAPDLTATHTPAAPSDGDGRRRLPPPLPIYPAARRAFPFCAPTPACPRAHRSARRRLPHAPSSLLGPAPPVPRRRACLARSSVRRPLRRPTAGLASARPISRRGSAYAHVRR